MKMLLTAIALIGVLTTPALAGSHERNYGARDAYDRGRGERDFIHAEAHRSHHVQHAASTKKGPSCCEVVVKAAADGAWKGALVGATKGFVTKGPAGVVPGAVDGAVGGALYKALDAKLRDRMRLELAAPSQCPWHYLYHCNP